MLNTLSVNALIILYFCQSPLMMFCLPLSVRSPFTCKYSVKKSAKSRKKSTSPMFTSALYVKFLFISSGLKLFASDELIPNKLQDSK